MKKALSSQELKALIEKKKAEVAKEEEAKAKQPKTGKQARRLHLANNLWKSGVSWIDRERMFEEIKRLSPELFPGDTKRKTLKEVVQDTQSA